jgi:hypothetical protein
MSRWLAWLTVAWLSVAVASGGFAAPDVRPPDAKPGEAPFANKPAANTARRPRDPVAAKPAARGPVQPKSASQGVVRKGPLCKGLRAGRAAVKKALAEKISLEFTETPLSDVIGYIKAQRKIEIQLDKKALDDVGVGEDALITCRLTGISLRSALKLLLHNLGLTFVIDDEVLLITTPEIADSHLETVVYDVADLVTCRDEEGRLWEDYDVLIEAITTTLTPTTWDDVGGPGSIAGKTFASAKVLVITQTDDVHEQVAGLLKEIRAVIKRHGGTSEPPRRARWDPPRKSTLHGLGDTGVGWHTAGGGEFGSSAKQAPKP